MLPLLLDSALRSLVLGAAVWALLKLARLCDTRTETAIWTAVLIAALAMPLLSHHIPGLVLNLPWSGSAPPSSDGALPSAAFPTAGLPAWDARHIEAGLLGIYFVGLILCGLRLAAGLLLTLRLYRRAGAVDAEWSEGRDIRVSAEIQSPVSLAGAILVTVDYRDWSPAKRAAVLAHEEAHIARGDFFVQLAARIHCVLFWFSPFAWWLQSKLAEIAETASDDAAVRRLDDRTAYAEILVEVARCAQRAPLIIAMAKSSFIEQRVDHILSEVPDRHLSPPLRALSLAAIAALAFAVAGARAVVSTPAPTAGRAGPALEARVVRRGQLVATHAGSYTPRREKQVAIGKSNIGAAAAPAALKSPSVARNTDEVTYNPRALLDPVYAARPESVPASVLVHAGKTYYVRANERPVADAGVVYGMDRQVRAAGN